MISDLLATVVGRLASNTWKPLLSFLLFAFAACTSVGPEAPRDREERTDRDRFGGDPGGPVIEEIISATTLTEGELLLLEVILRDPDGFEDIGPGELLSGDGAHRFGFFSLVQPGYYTAVIDWASLNAYEPIELDLGAVQTRTLRIEFRDTPRPSGLARACNRTHLPWAQWLRWPVCGHICE